MKRFAPAIVGTLAVLLMLFAAYMGSFYALIYGPWKFDQEIVLVMQVFYWPALRLDELIR